MRRSRNSKECWTFEPSNRRDCARRSYQRRLLGRPTSNGWMQWPSSQPPGVWSNHRNGGTGERFQLANPLRCFDQCADLGCRVVGRDMLRLVAEEKLAILQADPGDPKTMAIAVLKIVHANAPKAFGARAPEHTFIARSSASPRTLPARVVDVRHGTAFAGEDELSVPAPATLDHGSRNPIEHNVALEPVFHVVGWNDEDRGAQCVFQRW